MSRPDVPDFGALLAPLITRLPETARPALLCGLERSAAIRYREWAAELPEHSDALRACAKREDEIADLVAVMFPIGPSDQKAVDELLPEAIRIFLGVFAAHPVRDQLFIQSEAELQGAAAWEGIAAGLDDEPTRKILARCSELERESSRAVKALLEGRD